MVDSLLLLRRCKNPQSLATAPSVLFAPLDVRAEPVTLRLQIGARLPSAIPHAHSAAADRAWGGPTQRDATSSSPLRAANSPQKYRFSSVTMPQPQHDSQQRPPPLIVPAPLAPTEMTPNVISFPPWAKARSLQPGSDSPCRLALLADGAAWDHLANMHPPATAPAAGGRNITQARSFERSLHCHCPA